MPDAGSGSWLWHILIMPMLAERRKKQRLSIDPQNKNWANDSNKFGQRMLERMGWKDGSGLGANEQGIAAPVKLAPNGDQRGLGNSDRSDDTWLAHQDAYSEILESLNKSSAAVSASTSSSSNTKDERKETESLESISKKSRSRIHYHKFTRGKDLSRKSSDDIACVLGKKEKRRKRKRSKTAECESPPCGKVVAEKSSSEVPSPKTCAEELPVQQTTTSGVSYQDYFKSKMAAKLAALKKS